MTRTLFRGFHVTDLHLNPLDRVPQSRSVTYHADTLSEWRAFQEICERDAPDAILIPGDVFNLKQQKAYSPQDLTYYRQIFTDLGVPEYAIPGNHDLPNSAYELVSQSAYQALAFMTPSWNDVSFTVKTVKTVTLANGSTLPIRVAGIPYLPLEALFDAMPKLNRQLADMGPGLNIVLLHPDAMPQDDLPLHFEVCSWLDLLNALPSANVLCLGHIHHSYPVFQRQGPSGVQFVSKPWSQGRIVKDYYATSEVLELQHRPMYADIQLLETDTGMSLHIEYKEIPHTSFQHAFVRDALAKEIENSGRVVSFIQNLHSKFGSVEAAFQIDAPEDYLAKLDIPDKVRDRVEHYLAL